MRHRHHNNEKEKKFHKVWREYKELSDWRRREERGQWVKVEPYQRGWTRTYELRDDINNRDDAPFIRRALHLINNTVFCRTHDFLEWDWKLKKDVPMKQQLGNLTPEQYEKLNEKLRSYFVKHELIDIHRWPYYTRKLVTRYEFRNEFWFVFLIEPYIVEYHWIPDPEWESRYAEISHRIERNNWWPKIGKALGGHYNSRKEWKEDKWTKNKKGVTWLDDEGE